MSFVSPVFVHLAPDVSANRVVILIDEEKDVDRAIAMLATIGITATRLAVRFLAMRAYLGQRFFSQWSRSRFQSPKKRLTPGAGGGLQ